MNRNKARLRIFVLVIAALGACEPSERAEMRDTERVLDSYDIKVSELAEQSTIAGDFLHFPWRMAVVGRNLVVLDMFGDSAVHVIDLREERPGAG